MASRPLRDSDVRQAAYRRLLTHAQACPDTLVIDELGLDHGSCRIDIAVINGHIRGVEIKAEADTLVRLPRQVAAYGQVVDKALLIVAPKHLESAIEMVPDWWGVMVAERGATQGVRFRRVRSERANKGIDALVLARLLWRPEAQDLLRVLGVPERELRAPREELYQRIVSLLPLRKLANAVRTALKSRTTWRGQQPLS
ncbi:sce7726 family protein [Pelagerythrobacter marinus]|uniref:sce7726 family protein n=1 Tax=Pelagerythrobacter marinus TaxID=538382 RepID=UPI0020373A47|nr:sce7726 family protein [Pelagerythrobacter marinus]USA38881.1 sce7726 family protein [Pelagerythrobacter marinus]WPZ07039.1 sce7726 family protein [Pelagerythrobacter marinus]